MLGLRKRRLAKGVAVTAPKSIDDDFTIPVTNQDDTALARSLDNDKDVTAAHDLVAEAQLAGTGKVARSLEVAHHEHLVGEGVRSGNCEGFPEVSIELILAHQQSIVLR